MRCDRVRKLIPLGSGRDLLPEKQRVLEKHLRTCLSCYREFRAYRGAMSALATLAPPADMAAPAGLTSSIMNAVRSGEPGPAAPVSGTWSERTRYALPLAATFIGFALAGFYLFGGGSVDPGRAPVHLVPPINVPTRGMVVGFDGNDRLYDTLPTTIEIPRIWIAPGARAPVFDANQPIPVTTVPPVRMTGSSQRRGF